MVSVSRDDTFRNTFGKFCLERELKDKMVFTRVHCFINAHAQLWNSVSFRGTTGTIQKNMKD